MSIREIATGAAVTLLIGGTAYTVSQGDIAKNLAADTGMTQEQAEQYVNSVTDDQLASFTELGSEALKEGEELLDVAKDIDCANYEYEWESASLSCIKGKSQLEDVARDTMALGHAYKKLDESSASEADIREAIRLIDELNVSYKLEIMAALLDPADLEEWINTNAYNKAVLTAALESQ